MGEPFSDEAWKADHAFLQRVARGLLRDAHEAEDLAQDVLLASWRHRSRGVRSRNWLVGVARNLAVNRLRQRGRAPFLERGRFATDAAAEPALPHRNEGIRELVVAAVAGLREPYRTT